MEQGRKETIATKIDGRPWVGGQVGYLCSDGEVVASVDMGRSHDDGHTEMNNTMDKIENAKR